MKRILLLGLITVAALVIVCGVYLWFQASAPPEAPPAVVPPRVDLDALSARAQQGDVAAQESLGKAYTIGNGTKINYKEAAKWFALAATNGNVEAEAELGELYQAGQGVQRNLSKAVQLFAHAAEAGSVGAQYDLAFLYEQGQGVPKDEKLAAKWYRLASEGGDPTAQYDYGQRCVLGVGVAKDPVEGLKWLFLAQGRGQPAAAAKIVSVESTLSRAQMQEATQRAAAFVPRPSLSIHAP